MKLTWTGYEGVNRQLHELLLPDTVGRASSNQRPGSGDLRPWRAPLNVATLPAGRSAIYRMGRDAPADGTYWLSSQTDADYMRGFIADDTAERTFWTDGVIPKWTDNSFGLGAPPYPAASRYLGVPVPGTVNTEFSAGTKPLVAIQVAGAGDAEERFYVVTWVNDRGEESAPSAVSDVIQVKGGSTVRVTRNAGMPSGPWGINRWRIYRTVTATSGAADFYFVGEAADSSATFDDNVTEPQEPLSSTAWVRPPLELRGLVALWNGIAAGFVGKAIRFCEAYRPFAWPIQYELLVDDTIVALAVYQQNLLVLTTGKPYLITGSSPDSMSLQPIEMNQACVAKRSVVSLGHGVAWASPDGLSYFGQAGAKVATEGIFTRDAWQALKPATMVAGEAEGLYLVSYDPGGGRVSMLLSPTGGRGFYPMSAGFTATFRDTLQDALYLLNGTSVQRWDGGADQAASAESKTFLTPRHCNFSIAQITADNWPVSFDLWATDSEGHVYTYFKAVTGPRPFRLPAGFKADRWRLKLTTPLGGAVQGAVIAESMEELKST